MITYNDKRKLKRLLKKYPWFQNHISEIPTNYILIMSAGYDIGIDKTCLKNIFSSFSSFSSEIEYFIPKNESFSIISFKDTQIDVASEFLNTFHGFKYYLDWRKTEISFSMVFISNFEFIKNHYFSNSYFQNIFLPSSFCLFKNYLDQSLEIKLNDYCNNLYNLISNTNNHSNHILKWSN